MLAVVAIANRHELQLIAAGMALVGGALFVGFFVASAKSRRMKSWPAVTGRVTRSEVVRSRTFPNYFPAYEFRIEYRYAVDGNQYVGTRFAPYQAYSGYRDPADALAGKYPVGADVSVFYDPGRPGDAYLRPVQAGAALILLFAVSFIFGGLLVGLLAYGVPAR